MPLPRWPPAEVRARPCRRSGTRCGRGPGTRRESSRRRTVVRLELVLLERSLNPEYVSNSYLVAAGAGALGVLIDAGAPMEPLYEVVDKRRVNVAHLLLTHPHHDHVSEAPDVK